MKSIEARLTVAAGGLATALGALGAVLLLRLPGVDESPEQVHVFVTGHRTLLLAAACCWGLAATATAAFCVGLSQLVRSGPAEPRLAAHIGLAGGMALVAMEFVGWGFLLPLAYRPVDAATSRLMADTVFLLLAFAGFPAALWTIAASWSLRRNDQIGRWLEWLGYFSAIAHIEAGFALNDSGPFSPSGFGAYLAPVLISAWIALVTLAVATRGMARPSSAVS